MDVTNSQEIAHARFIETSSPPSTCVGRLQKLEKSPRDFVDDVTFNMDSFFNVPGVVNFNSRLFSARLSVLRAQAAAQLAEREQTMSIVQTVSGGPRSRRNSRSS